MECINKMICLISSIKPVRRMNEGFVIRSNMTLELTKDGSYY